MHRGARSARRLQIKVFPSALSAYSAVNEWFWDRFYYAHGVGEETATLPQGWRERLVPLRTDSTGNATGLCLEVHDLAVSKIVAGRTKDLVYVALLLRHGLAKGDLVRERLRATSLSDDLRRACTERLDRIDRGLAQA